MSKHHVVYRMSTPRGPWGVFCRGRSEHTRWGIQRVVAAWLPSHHTQTDLSLDLVRRIAASSSATSRCKKGRREDEGR